MDNPLRIFGQKNIKEDNLSTLYLGILIALGIYAFLTGSSTATGLFLFLLVLPFLLLMFSVKPMPKSPEEKNTDPENSENS